MSDSDEARRPDPAEDAAGGAQEVSGSGAAREADGPRGGQDVAGSDGGRDVAGPDGAAEADPPREPSVAPEDLTNEERGIVATLQGLIGEIKEEARGRAHAGARLQSDVGLDSVAIIDLVIAAEDEFDIEIPDDETGDLMDATLAELARRVGRLAA